MKIQITQEHIDKGIKRDPLRCPIALALKDNVKTQKTISVHPYGMDLPTVKGCIYMYSFGQGGSYQYVIEKFSLPEHACNFAYAFDNGKEVHPFELELDFLEEPKKDENVLDTPK